MIALNIIFFTLSCIFFSLWLDHKTRLHAAVHPFLIYSLLTLALYAGGLAGVMVPAAWVITYGGGAGLLAMLAMRVDWLVKSWRRIWKVWCLFAIFFGAVWFYFMVSMPESFVVSYDHVNHWGFVPKLFYETGSFYREFHELARYLAYPPLPILGTYYFLFIHQTTIDNAMLVSQNFANIAALFALFAFVDFRRHNIAPFAAVAVAGAAMIVPDICTGTLAVLVRNLIPIAAMAVALGFFVTMKREGKKALFVFTVIGLYIAGQGMIWAHTTLKDMQMGYFLAGCLAIYFGTLRRRPLPMLLWLLLPLASLQMCKATNIVLVIFLLVIILVDRTVLLAFSRQRKKFTRKRVFAAAAVAGVMLIALAGISLSWSVFLNSLSENLLSTVDGRRVAQTTTAGEAWRAIVGGEEMSPEMQELYNAMRQNMFSSLNPPKVNFQHLPYTGDRTGDNVPKWLLANINSITPGGERTEGITVWSQWFALVVFGIPLVVALLMRRKYAEAAAGGMAVLLFLAGSVVYYFLLMTVTYHLLMPLDKLDFTFSRYYWVMSGGAVAFLIIMYSALTAKRDKALAATGVCGLLVLAVIYTSAPRPLAYQSSIARASFHLFMSAAPEVERALMLLPPPQPDTTYDQFKVYYRGIKCNRLLANEPIRQRRFVPYNPMNYDNLVLFSSMKGELFADDKAVRLLPEGVNLRPHDAVSYVMKPSAEGRHQVIAAIYSKPNSFSGEFYRYSEGDEEGYFLRYEVAADDKNTVQFTELELTKEPMENNGGGKQGGE